jgi:16S rRNA (guanine527-N7)-methyltransferase
LGSPDSVAGPGKSLVIAVPDAAQRAQLERFLEELYAWNERLNLTTVPRADGWRRHVDESLVAVTVLDPGTGTVVDLGSGGGLPGIPTAVVLPECRVVLLEADRRKAGFLTHVAGLLGLARVEVVSARAEDHGRSPARESYDAVISRATAPPAVLCELGLPLLHCGGLLVGMVRDAPAAARSAAAAAQLCGGGRPEARGELLLVSKAAPTPEIYPRRSGIPQRDPLSAS